MATTLDLIPEQMFAVSEWYDIEWRPKSSISPWRRAYKMLNESDARKQMDDWAADYDCQLVKFTLTKEVIPE